MLDEAVVFVIARKRLKKNGQVVRVQEINEGMLQV